MSEHLHRPAPLDSRPRPPQRSGLGLPWWVVLGLAALAAPRVVLHDLGVMPDSPLLMALLVVGPPLVWVLVALRARVPSPVLTLAVVGLLYGVLLAVLHNVFWDEVFGDAGPVLGGNLRGELSGTAEEVVLRGAASASSVLTGTVVGLLAGLVALGARRLTRRTS